jgi:hypothetical protein
MQYSHWNLQNIYGIDERKDADLFTWTIFKKTILRKEQNESS